MISDSERTALLRSAREAIERHLHGLSGPPDPRPPDPRTPDSRAPASSDAFGVFVTIKRHGELRGCLGVLQMRGRLVDEVVRCARDSATADPRFPPMTADEIGDMLLEISVLGPLELLDPLDQEAITIGRHGLVVEMNGRRGLLLPQVATEWGWTPEQFLSHTCRKAGLPEDAWRNGARVFRFDAEVFGEVA